ncbi:hypothetical protein [Streptomyces sp. NPDC048845]|uniref:effector-associated constant component EACC1 n=1 Tax=Streptomyces sp. NPDC048845 TaxID=3155390 RepID=UPI0034188B91
MPALYVEFDGPPAEASDLVRDLTGWLGEDEELEVVARARTAPPLPGEQGGLADAAELLTAAGAVIGPLAGAYVMWLAERTKSRRISFRLTRPDGARLELSAASPDEARALQPDLERFVNGLPAPGTPGDGGPAAGGPAAGGPAEGGPAAGSAAPGVTGA